MSTLRRGRAGASGMLSLAMAAGVLMVTGAVAWAADELPGGGGSVQPSAELAELQSHIPEVVATNCVDDPVDESRQDEGSLARILCTTSEQSTVRYELFNSLDTMDEAFELTRFVSMTFGHDELAHSCATGWYDEIWYLGDEGVPGRLLCLKPLYGEESAIVLWSHPATRIVSFIRQTDGDAEAAWNLWIAAGPS